MWGAGWINRHQYRYRKFLIFILPLLLLQLLAACDMDDRRDECCESNQVRFRYLYRGSDRFTDYISTVRYFLFDAGGTFLREMYATECSPATVSICSLEAGSYTLVAVGNLGDYGSLGGYVEEGLEAFRLSVDKHFPQHPSAFANGDNLYRGECSFTVAVGATNSFIGEMSNVHCILRLKVEWELVPRFSEGYRYCLKGIGTGMEMNGTHAYSIDVHSFPPATGYDGQVMEEVPLRRFALNASLVTLRWTDDEIPCFILYHDDTPVTKEIDLKSVFRQWGWYPSQTPVQIYEIRMLIHSNGSIEINQGLEVGVNDWIDGGTFG